MATKIYQVQAPDGSMMKIEGPLDATDDELISVAEANFKPATKASFSQKLEASVPGRILKGMRDPIDAGAQLLPRGLEYVTSAGGLAPNPVAEFFGAEAQRVDTGDISKQGQLQGKRALILRDWGAMFCLLQTWPLLPGCQRPQQPA